MECISRHIKYGSSGILQYECTRGGQFITLCHPRLNEEHMRLIAKAIKKVCLAYGK